MDVSLDLASDDTAFVAEWIARSRQVRELCDAAHQVKLHRTLRVYWQLCTSLWHSAVEAQYIRLSLQ